MQFAITLQHSCNSYLFVFTILIFFFSIKSLSFFLILFFCLFYLIFSFVYFVFEFKFLNNVILKWFKHLSFSSLQTIIFFNIPIKIVVLFFNCFFLNFIFVPCIFQSNLNYYIAYNYHAFWAL